MNKPLILAAFSLSESGAFFRDGDMFVYPAAKLFKTGDYSDKGFTKPVTADDLARIVATFSPDDAPVNIEHESVLAGTESETARLLHGKMGKVRRVWLDEAREWVMGEVEIPSWLNDATHPKQLSVEIFPDSMKLAGLALTGNPRCSGAALLSAYQQTTKGQNEVTTLSEAAEKSLVEKITDNLAAKFPALFGRKEDDKPEIKPDPQVATMSAKVTELETRLITADAEKFVDGIIGKFAMPAERSNLIAQYVTAAQDDAKSPTVVTFSDKDGKPATGTRVAQFTASQLSRSDISYLLKEHGSEGFEIRPSSTIVKLSKEEEEKATKERQSKLMDSTDLGRAAMMKNGGQN